MPWSTALTVVSIVMCIQTWVLLWTTLRLTRGLQLIDDIVTTQLVDPETHTLSAICRDGKIVQSGVIDSSEKD